MKKRLIILSDLWGDIKNDWIANYFNSLDAYFKITYYDCCELGNVDKNVESEEKIHSQFINNGINIAVEKLLKLELEEVDVLAFSIGGTIAWKGALNGLKINNLYAISATRLRYETEFPACNIKLSYGADDSFIPSFEWFNKMKLQFNIINGVGHEIYSDNKYTPGLCTEIKK